METKVSLSLQVYLKSSWLVGELPPHEVNSKCLLGYYDAYVSRWATSEKAGAHW